LLCLLLSVKGFTGYPSVIVMDHTVSTTFLKPGSAKRVDPGPSRPRPGTSSGGGKNPLGSWPGGTQSTRRVDPGPGPPGLFFLYSSSH
jgi:hypothetical protein